MNYKEGASLIRIILIIALLVVFISLLGWDIQSDVVENEQVQTNFGFVLNWLSGVWENHLQSPVLYLWNDVFVELLWQPFVQEFLTGDWINQIQNPGDLN
jgi:hypothetical protein